MNSWLGRDDLSNWADEKACSVEQLTHNFNSTGLSGMIERSCQGYDKQCADGNIFNVKQII